MVIFSLPDLETATLFVVTSVSQALTHAPNPATQPPLVLIEEEIKIDTMVLARRRTKTWYHGRITEIKPTGKNSPNHRLVLLLYIIRCPLQIS